MKNLLFILSVFTLLSFTAQSSPPDIPKPDIVKVFDAKAVSIQADCSIQMYELNTLTVIEQINPVEINCNYTPLAELSEVAVINEVSEALKRTPDKSKITTLAEHSPPLIKLYGSKEGTAKPIKYNDKPPVNRRL